MSEILILISSLVVAVFLFICIVYFLKKYNEKQKQSFEENWDLFNKAILINDFKGINKFSENLIWNKNIDLKHINDIEFFLKANEFKHPNFNRLINVIYNKKLDWETIEDPFIVD